MIFFFTSVQVESYELKLIVGLLCGWGCRSFYLAI